MHTTLNNSLILISLAKILDNTEKPYLLSNEINNSLDIFFKQKGLNNSFLEILEPFEERFYIPDSPVLEAAISLVFKDKITKKVFLESEINLNKSEKFVKFNNVLYCERTFTEKQMKFTFKSHDFEEEKAQEEELSQTFELKLDNVGISVIYNTGGIAKLPYELCYILIKDVEFYLMEDRVSRLIQLKFGDLHLENNSLSNLPLVYLRNKEKEVSVFNIYIEQKITLETQLLYLNCFKMQIDDISVNIEIPFIQITGEFIKEIKNLFKKYKENPEIILEDLSFPFNLINKNNVSYWQTVPFTAPNNNLFIKELFLSPLLLKVSYKKSHILLPNIDNKNILLPALQFPNYFYNISALLVKIYNTYIEIVWSDFKLLGLLTFVSAHFIDIAGLFIKPITTLFSAPEENTKKTIRYKRPFYGVEKFYKEYWQEDGEIMEFLEKFKKGKYAKLSFFNFVKVPDDEKKEKILVIMIEVILLLSMNKQRKDWKIETKNIRKIEALKDGFLIMSTEKIKKIEVFIKCFLRLS